ncbi:hypothetical protein Ancab_019677 [Ancistrocladus abbreviatus]
MPQLFLTTKPPPPSSLLPPPFPPPLLIRPQTTLSSRFTAEDQLHMEGITAKAYKGIRGYWKRKGYERLNGPSSRKQRKSRVELAQMGSAPDSNPRRRRRLWRWRIKLSPKIRICSPKKWLTKLRDAYVKMMLSLANSAPFSSGVFGAVDYGTAFGRPALKEYDEKMIVEIYKSLVMAQGQIVPCEPGKISSQIIGSR